MGTKNSKHASDASALNSAQNSLTVEECLALEKKDAIAMEKEEIEENEEQLGQNAFDVPMWEPTTYAPTTYAPSDETDEDAAGAEGSKDDGSVPVQYSNGVGPLVDGLRRDLRGEAVSDEVRRLADEKMKVRCEAEIA